MIGSRFGPYEVTRMVGAGGMGSVYLAERVDGQFTKQVAIKVVTAAQGDRTAIDRFLQERETLAALDHPNIVKLLDGGVTEQGLPYFIMDYVEGTPIEEYSEQQRLSVDARLKLFIQVCDAVQYAHRLLIVHRDIKPRNIIVTTEGIPKLLDFGISKLLGQKSSQTALEATHAFRTFTLEYASPEQVRSQPITTAVDVYALGVLLYDLLTGEWPYPIESKNEIALAYAICESEPRRPSAATNNRELRRRLEGDLDAIILKAIAKKPLDRYGSVADFGADLDRSRTHRPVLARAQTTTYRLQRFIARNRAAVIAGTLAAVIAIGGVIGIIRQYRIAGRERDLAERRFQGMKDLLGTFLFDVHDNIREVPGTTKARSMLVNQASMYLGWLAEQARDDTKLQLDLADAYLKLAASQGDPSEMNTGMTSNALQSIAKARQVAEAVLAKRPQEPRAKRYLALAAIRSADILEQQGKMDEALAAVKEATPELQRLAARDPNNVEAHQDLASAFESQSDLLARTSNNKGSLESLQDALEEWRAVLRLDPKNFRARRAQPITRIKMGNVYLDTGNVDRAIANYQEGMDALDALIKDTGRPELRRLRALLLGRFAIAQWQLRHYDLAIEKYREQQQVLEELAQTDPNDLRARNDLALCFKNQIDLLWNLDRVPEALTATRSAIAILEKLVATDADNQVTKTRFAETLIQAGYVLQESKMSAEARSMTQRGLALYAELAKSGSPVHSYFAEALLSCEPPDLRDPAKALDYAEKAVKATKGENLFNLDLLARSLAANQNYSRALEISEQALAKLPAEPKTQLREVFENHVKEYRK